MDPELSPAEAEELALEHGLGVEEFEWYPVGEIGNVRNEGAELFTRIDDPLL